jgi:16S rRNA (guanine527-N7)-methyltransferase
MPNWVKYFRVKTVLLLKNWTMDEILKYFPNLTDIQKEQFEKLDFYTTIGTKNKCYFEKRLTLYIQSIFCILWVLQNYWFCSGYLCSWRGNWWWIWIPLAILFRKRFHLIDIIAKKIKVVQAVVDGLGLENVKAEQLRAELVKGDFDFIVSRN